MGESESLLDRSLALSLTKSSIRRGDCNRSVIMIKFLHGWEKEVGEHHCRVSRYSYVSGLA